MNFRLDNLFNFKITTLAERKYRISQLFSVLVWFYKFITY